MRKKRGLNKKTINIDGRDYSYYDINTLDEIGLGDMSRLPYSLKILLENTLRNYDERLVTMEHITRIASMARQAPKGSAEKSSPTDKGEIPFIPSRILLQDFTGVPVVVDLAAMRSAMHEMGGDAGKINPSVPVDLVIDHSVNVDFYGTNEAMLMNVEKEFERNSERYQLLKWAQRAFSNFRVFPPSIGIVHQVNLEYLAEVATIRKIGDEDVILPDTLLGTDSHTTMINGIGVLGWGVGGIEAEACMLSQPYYFLQPELVGIELTGRLNEAACATDLVLTITNLLRKLGVVGKLVEFFGDGLDSISVEDRATVANMCPEYGATCAYFPVDEATLKYLRSTGRPEGHIAMVEQYYKAQGMFRTKDSEKPVFSNEISINLSEIKPSLAGPKRPQDRIDLTDMKKSFSFLLTAPIDKGGYDQKEDKINQSVEIRYKDGITETLKTGAVVISAITSCTNTSNPAVVIGAGLLAKKAVQLGLKKPRYVKASLAPGSLVVTEYLKKSNLLPYLEQLGYNIVGYGCTTCIGNSGPLLDEITEAIDKNDMIVAAVLSGNRNFEGRVHSRTRMNFLCSPILVVAYGLAGTVNINFESEPIGYGHEGKPVYLKDIWPDNAEIRQLIESSLSPEMYINKYSNLLDCNKLWNSLAATDEKIYKWSKGSSYIKKPPFFDDITKEPPKLSDITGANVLAMFGDSVTTDHISPAGSIPEASDSGIHLTSQNIKPQHFNSYGSRRGSHEVMMRGTFANIRIRNRMLPGVEGGFTRHIPSNEIMTIYQASCAYKESNTPLIVIAGKEYGTGSSRDWAAKGTMLLGVKAVLAEGFERIHRSNLVGMGVLPLQFMEGMNADSLGLSGYESYDITGIAENLYPNKLLKITATDRSGNRKEFEVIARLDNYVELEYYINGGILNMILRNFMHSDH